MRRYDRNELENRIFQSLGFDKLGDEAALERTKQELGSEETQRELANLIEKAQKKRMRIRQNLNTVKKVEEPSQEMKELQWRLQVLREDKKQRALKANTFDQVYKMQKNKYSKFRERNKIKMSDSRYIDMIGSMQMRREKRRLNNLDKIDKHLEILDSSIRNHRK